MSVVLLFLILITFLSICYQDFKVREVYLLTYFLLYFLIFMDGLISRVFLNIDFIIINSCMLIAVSCLLLMYYLIRYGKVSLSKLKASVGWGDILMVPVFVVSFSPANMIFVFIFTLVLSLVYHVVSNFRSLNDATIPLAGIQSLVLSALFCTDSLGLFKMQVDFFPLF